MTENTPDPGALLVKKLNAFLFPIRKGLGMHCLINFLITRASRSCLDVDVWSKNSRNCGSPEEQARAAGNIRNTIFNFLGGMLPFRMLRIQYTDSFHDQPTEFVYPWRVPSSDLPSSAIPVREVLERDQAEEGPALRQLYEALPKEEPS